MPNALYEIDLRAACDSLRAEPLFHMSLGSKELFHSNFMRWLFLCFPNQATDALLTIPRLLVPLAGSIGEPRVLREYKRFDLALILPGYRPLVIENKMFSVPRRGQLAEYAHSVGHDRALAGATLCLLSPLRPAWLSASHEGGTWIHLGYRDLIASLNDQVTPLRHTDPFAAEILARYCTMTTTIVAILEHFAVALDPLDKFNLPAETNKALEAIGIRDGVVKLRADAIASMIEERLRAECLSDRLYVAANFTRKKPLIEVFQMNGAKIAGPKNPTNRVGWQFQEDQWRLAMILPGIAGRGTADRARRNDFASRYRPWFDFAPLEAILGSLTRGRRSATPVGDFNVFDPDFVYDYRSVPAITVGQLVELGTEYARRAAAFQLS